MIRVTVYCVCDTDEKMST